jgi:hypothetical protein
MTEVFIYDHVRTPRGRGKADGALHEVTALNLATQALATLRERNWLDPSLVDDVVMGCVDPVGEAGGDIARVAAICAGYGNGVPGVQINRFCASGLDAVNFAAAEVMSGQHDMAVGGGVESMSRVGIGASGGAWPVDPAIAVPSYFMPQGVSADRAATRPASIFSPRRWWQNGWDFSMSWCPRPFVLPSRRKGANLSGAAGALSRWLSRRRCERHYRSSDGPMAVGAAWPTIYYREPAGRRQ